LIDTKEVVNRKKLLTVLRTRGSLEIEDDLSEDQLLSRIGQLAEDCQQITPPSDPQLQNHINILPLQPHRGRVQSEERVAERERQTSEQESSYQQGSTSRHSEASHNEDEAAKEIPLPPSGTGLPRTSSAEFIPRPQKRSNTSEELPSQRKKKRDTMILELSATSAVDGSPKSSSFNSDDNSSDGGSSRCISASSLSGSLSPSLLSSSSLPDDIQAESPFHPLHSNTPEQVAVLCSIQLPSSLSPLSPEEVQMERERQKKLAQERRRTEALLSDIDMNRQRNIMKEWWRWCREGGEKF